VVEATSGRRHAAAAALAAAVVWGSACSTSPPRDISAIVDACFGQTPKDWAAALDSSAVSLPDGVRFGVGALAGDSMFGQFNSTSGNGIAELDMKTGRLTEILSFGADVSGMGGMAVDLPWLIWEQLDSQTNQFDWSLHAWNRNTGVGTVLSTSHQNDGTFVVGQQPLPVINQGVAAWAQPVPAEAGQARAEIRVLDLSTDEILTLDSGEVSSPVYAGPYLLWAKKTKNDFSFQAVDARTLKPVTVPEGLHDPGDIAYVAGSTNYVIWSNQDYTSLTAWRIDSSHHREFASPDHRHHFQFLQTSGDFALWFGGAASSILDLRTGKAFDVQGTVAGSSDRIGIAEWVSEPASRRAVPMARVSSIASSAAPRIAHCAASGP
jgi:hypothetical protein